MGAGATRDDGELQHGLQQWFDASSDVEYRVASLHRPAAGYSSETVIVDLVRGGVDERVVLRLPLLVSSYPEYDLREQADVLDALADSPIPAPRVVALETDESFLGAPFLLMSFATGRPVGEVPALDPWLLERPEAEQRAVHEQFADTLATLHSFGFEHRPVAARLRSGLDAELRYWARYVEWAADGQAPARVLVDALAWCRETRPAFEPQPSLLWGDARLGNVLFGEDARVSAVLDWELATIGPAEMDLAWYLALDELTTHFVGRNVPGFLSRDAFVDRYERALGRNVEHLAWHEVFALVRSVAINDRQARLAAAARTPYPGVYGDDNPILAVLQDRIDRTDHEDAREL